MQPRMPTSCNPFITASHKTLHKYCSAKTLLPIIQIMIMHLCVYWCLLHFKMQGRMWTRKFHGCSILTHSLRTPGVHIFVPYLGGNSFSVLSWRQVYSVRICCDIVVPFFVSKTTCRCHCDNKLMKKFENILVDGT